MLCIISFLLLGCASMSDVMKSKSDGISKVYPVSTDQAWIIARTVFRWEGGEAIEEHKDEGYMLTNSGMNLITFGTLMAAWIEAVDNNNSKVTAVTKRRNALDLVTTLTETTFHVRFAQAVDIIKSGKPLPLDAPEYPQ